MLAEFHQSKQRKGERGGIGGWSTSEGVQRKREADREDLEDNEGEIVPSIGPQERLFSGADILL